MRDAGSEDGRFAALACTDPAAPPRRGLVRVEPRDRSLRPPGLAARLVRSLGVTLLAYGGPVLLAWGGFLFVRGELEPSAQCLRSFPIVAAGCLTVSGTGLGSHAELVAALRFSLALPWVLGVLHAAIARIGRPYAAIYLGFVSSFALTGCLLAILKVRFVDPG